MIGLSFAYWLIGLFLAATAVRAARGRHWTRAAFWGLLALLFLAGNRLPAALVGAAVLALALLAAFGRIQAAAPAEDAEALRQSAARFGNRLFLPALAIPLLTLAALFGLKRVVLPGGPLLDPANATLASLALACAAALLIALAIVRDRPGRALDEGGRLLETIGWAAILPLYLAALGTVFAKAGVGDAVAALLKAGLPLGSRFAAVAAYGTAMALLTFVMGNAFAAFPVVTAGIGLPVLVGVHGADPAAMAAMGMLTGYCGTLLTPMAANYNLVPAALLELKDPNAVIRAQAPTAFLLFAANLVLMNLLIFR